MRWWWLESEKGGCYIEMGGEGDEGRGMRTRVEIINRCNCIE